ncbi:MAG: LapA family protein [Hydrogenothermaceae bacterium]|nr:LapA family protein [Hydrogenothermaceae bacterium]
MLSKIRLIVWLIILLVVAYFVAMNNTTVTVNLFPGYQTVPMPLSIVIIFSVIVGAILAIILTIGDWIKFKVENSKLSKQLKDCQQQLNNLQQISSQPKKSEEENRGSNI